MGPKLSAIPQRLFGPAFSSPGYLAPRWLFLRAPGGKIVILEWPDAPGMPFGH
jgi:hypothetical protein